uniref:Uncharacterized protein n=1 Tax=Esox lucius TaxID=8010 RepID=A0A3P8Z0P2_ESOLU
GRLLGKLPDQFSSPLFHLCKWTKMLVMYFLWSHGTVQEHCHAPAILRQLSPREADLVRDPSMHCKVRFRFSGSQFPPAIVFKIFHLGTGRQFISGKRIFQPSTQATTDACRMMGNRKFINHIIADEIQRQGRIIADTCDITCVRDFMQYSSHLDELPAYLGGRENSWRYLSLRRLSRNILQWDSLRVRGQGAEADKLKLMLLDPHVLRTLIGGAVPPQTLRSPAGPPSSVGLTARRAPTAPISFTSLPSTRRSARARITAARMRHLYLFGGTLKVSLHPTYMLIKMQRKRSAALASSDRCLSENGLCHIHVIHTRISACSDFRRVSQGCALQKQDVRR